VVASFDFALTTSAVSSSIRAGRQVEYGCPRVLSAAHEVLVGCVQVIEGMDLVEAISKVATRNDNPLQPVKMISVRVA
jgi:Cyclophilin type peptidyl-prolyl cis-trans isomerase/CLD